MKRVFGIFLLIIFLIIQSPAEAIHRGRIHKGDACVKSNGDSLGTCEQGTTCKASPQADGSIRGDCIEDTSQGSGSSSVDAVFGKINPPAPVSRIGYGNVGLSNFLTNVISIIFLISGIAFLFMMIIGGFQWIVSGGDKGKVEGAQKRITNAVVGIVVLSLVFLAAKFVGDITGFQFFANGVLAPISNITPEQESCNRLASQGFRWDGTKCVDSNAGNSSAPNSISTQEACNKRFAEGYRWDGTKCINIF